MPRQPGGAAHLTLRWLLPALLGLLALAVRALPRQQVLVGGDVFAFGHDSYYHLRRIAYSVVRFPDVLDFDPYINYPDGAKPIWSPVFDWLVALVALPFYRPGDLETVERVAIWVPPLLGAATVVSLYALARRHHGACIAVVSALILCFLSAHFWYSQVGFVDHHAAVALVTTWLLAAAMGFLERQRQRAGRGAAGTTAALGAALAGVLLVWPGGLLHVALAEVGLVGAWLAQADAARAERVGRHFAAAHLLAGALLLPFASHWPQWGSTNPLVLSRFQPWLFGTAALCAVLSIAAWRQPRLGGSRARRAGTALGVAVLALGASVALLPELRSGAADAMRWLFRSESFQASVAESQPLFLRRGTWEIDPAVSRLSWFVFLFPFAALAAAFRFRRLPNRAALWLWIFWSVGLFAATLAQRRFFNSFAVAMALTMGWSVVEAQREISRRWPAPPARRAATLALAFATLLLLWPLAGSYRLHLANELRSAGAPQGVQPWLLERRSLIELARWLSVRTPATAGWMDARLRPEYGVLASWEIGHLLEYEARRPTVTDEFGDDIGERNFQLARRYFLSREPDASAILDRLGVRYVVAQPRPGFLGENPEADCVFAALYFFDGTERARRPAGAPRALTRHRLVYEARTASDDEPEASYYKVFEHVPGAVLTGRARPGSRIQLTLPLRTNRGREIVYLARADTGADGRYELRVPYANRGGPPAVRAGPAYALACGAAEARVVVDEAAVSSGVRVPGPDLCL